jgi:hypothetical protein
MELVECKLLLELPNLSNKFGDSWNFSLDGFNFVKISAETVEVTFSYTAEIESTVEGARVIDSPSHWDHAYIDTEEKLQRLLDLICLQKSGIAIRIVEDSQRFTYRSGSSNTTTHTHVVEISELQDIQIRYDHLNSMDNDRLADALRLNRLASGEENVGEEIAQLWGSIESLYGSDLPKVLNTRDKRREINNLIDQAILITDDEKDKLKQGLGFINVKSLPAIMSEKLKLVNGNGTTMTPNEVTETLKYWRGTRSLQSHGSVLIRDHTAHLLAGEMSFIIETILGAEVNPSRYVFIIFHPSQLYEDRFTDGTPIDDGESGYVSKSIHQFAAINIEKNLRYQLNDDSSCIYLVDYAKVSKVTRSETILVGVGDLPEAIRKSVIQKMRRLNHEE